MTQQQLNVELTGFQRFILTNLWHKRGREGDKEEFIKQVCIQKGLIYTPPKRVDRPLVYRV